MSDDAPSPRKTKKIKVPDRTFRRLEERSRPTAPLPTAWAAGLFLGALAGVAVGAWDVALLQRAGLVVLPELSADLVLPRVVAHAALGGGLGLLAGATGLWSVRWATAVTVLWVAWLLSGTVAAAVGGGGAGAIAFLITMVLAFVASQALGRIPAPAYVHSAISTHVAVCLTLLSPFQAHLMSSATSAGAVTFGLAVALMALPLAPLAALFSREGRPPVLGVLVLLSTGAGAVVVTSGAPPRAWAPTRTGPLAVVVAVDGLRADHLGAPGGKAGLTPNLTALGRKGVVFTHAYATSNWSVPSLASVLTGRWPYGHGAGLNDGGDQLHTPLRADVPTLAAELGEDGWGTAAVVADPTLRSYALDTGFQVWRDDPPGGAPPSAAAPLRALGLPLVAWGAPSDAARVTDRALAQAALDPGRARLLVVQYADLAGPYLASDADRAEVGHTTRPWPTDEVEAALLGLDREIGRLLAGLPDDAWVVVLGTRGMVIGEQRDPELSASGAPYGTTMFEEQIRVPLVVRGPGVQPRTVDELASLVDVAPTLLRATQGERPPGEAAVTLRDADGVVLGPVFGADADPDRAILAQSTREGRERQAVLLAPHKLVRNGRGTFLYDLSADPHETQALRLDGSLDALARRLDSLLPPDGAGAELHDPPPLVLQLGQFFSRLWGGR